jgi:hypothetical protein
MSLGLVLLAGSAAGAAACPNCALGREARREVWNDDFAFNLCVALLPFVLIGSICVRLETSAGLLPDPGGAEESEDPGVTAEQATG